MKSWSNKSGLFAFLLIVLFVSMAGVASADVLINEILAHGVDDQKTEWIEIYNNASSSADISNWNISDIATTAKNFTINGTIIPPRGFVILANNFTVFNSTFPSVNGSGIKIIEYGPSTGSPALSNTGDTLFLYNSSGNIVDTFAYAQASTQENVSIGRIPDGSGNILNLTVLTPGGKNDNAAPVFNKWINPAANNSFIKGLVNITVNITDAAYSVNASLINFNNTNYTMNRNEDTFYYLWNTSLNAEQQYNLTIFFNDTLGFSNADTIYNIEVDNTKPNIYDPTTTANSRNFVSKNSAFNASVTATDSNLLNVTCTLEGLTVGNSSRAGDVHSCSLTSPSAENDYTITFTAIDKAGNTNITTASFTTKHSTDANLTAYSITVSGMNQSNKIVEVTATFNNKGLSTIYSPNIIIEGFVGSFAEATTDRNKTCAANLSAGQSCSAAFNITIFGGKPVGSYAILWNANWTDNNLTSNRLIEAATSYAAISSNPQITVAENMTATIQHNTNQTLNILLNSTGNAHLQNVNIAFNSLTLQNSWITITPSSFSSIAAGTNETFNATIAIPRYTSPGDYTGILTITATNAETKSILLRAEVPEDSSWTSYPSGITVFRNTDSSGLLGTIYINNTGNTGHRFDFASSGTLRTFIWDSSLNPTSKYVEKGTTEAVNFYHKEALAFLDSYKATLIITSFNKSTVNYTSLSLTRDDTNPSLSITSPLNNTFVKEKIGFNVTASDLNLSTIKFYISDNLVLDDVSLTKTFKWNTTNGSYPDGGYILKAIAYDSAGNSNPSIISVTLNNTDDSPVLNEDIPQITWDEDTTTTLNLSKYFMSIDGDNLTYISTAPDNVAVSINNTSSTVTLTPEANFFGIRHIVFYANDTSGNLTASNNVTAAVNNINDAPSAPTPLLPANNSAVFSATGKVALNWTASTDADNANLTYYVFYGTGLNVTSTENTQKAYLILNNLNNATIYYWKVYASDGAANSANSSTSQFTVTVDGAPAIINYTPSNLTPSVAENATLMFNITASDPDGGSLNYTWHIDGVFNKTDGNSFNYAPNFAAAGNHIILANITDNNSNSVSNTWAVTVKNTNREPVLDAISDKEAVEDSTLTFNITASDPDNGSLTFSSNISAITFAKSANNSLATASWVPTNGYVGNNTILFTVSDGSKTDAKIATITVTNTNDAPIIADHYPKENKTIAELIGSQKFNISVADMDKGDSVQMDWFINGTFIISVTNSVSENDPQPVNSGSEITITNKTKGAYNISVIAHDRSNLELRQSWILTVTTDIFGDGLTSPVLKLNETQRQNVTNVTINQTIFGGIDFGNNTMNFSGVAVLEDAFNISKGIISVDTAKFPGLNKSASLNMNGLNYTKSPLIYISSGFEDMSNGAVCPDNVCANKTYDISRGILRFNVPHFSTYYTQANATNGAPIITSTPATQATERARYTYDVDATDPDGDTLIYSLITSPSGMSINNNTGLISWAPSISNLGLNNVIVGVSDGSLTNNQSFQISVDKGPMLSINNLDAKIDGKTSKSLQNNAKISKRANPGSNIEFKIGIENLFTREEDLKIEDIITEIAIEGIYDGDDIEGDANEFSLKAGKKENVKINLGIPLEVDEGTYNVKVNVEGKDENRTRHKISYNLQLEVKKENHEIRITKATLAPSTIKCQGQISIGTEIMNTGNNDEDDVSLAAASPELGINSVTKGITLDEGTEDNIFAKLITASISQDILPGTYPITISTHYGDKLSDTKTVELIVQECELTKQIKQEVKEEKPTAGAVIMPAIIKEQKPAAPVKASFEQTNEYELLIAILAILFTGTAVFIIGAAFIILRK